MLRDVPHARFERHVTLLGRRYALVLDQRRGPVMVWGARAFRAIRSEQDKRPVPLLEDGHRRWWLFEDRIWAGDGDLDTDDVLALVRDRSRRRRRRVAHARAALAHDRAHRDAGGHATRTDRRGRRRDPERPPTGPTADRATPADRRHRRPIPVDVRRAVWTRDDGRCTACGTDFDLQFDHVIPIATGGADTVENLQVLCGPCNRAKGATVG
ncbi:MAG: HNH endonuclease [Solirubrobacteraceae bacterium]|nr:HNH endonuclease [Solirubrobacteraceae bacterium]